MDLYIDPIPFARHLDTVNRIGAAVARVLMHEHVDALLREAERLDFRKAEPVAGPNRVVQDYATAEPGERGPIIDVAAKICSAIQRASDRMHPPLMSEYFIFNEILVQRYEASSEGVTEHRDFKSDRNLVCSLVLEDGGEFVWRENGSAEVKLDAHAGDLIMIRAPGFGGSDRRPLHKVHKITRRRTVLIMRQRA